MAIKRRDNSNGFDSGTIGVRDSVYNEALGIYDTFGSYDKWNTFDTGTGVVDNPYALTAKSIRINIYFGSNPVEKKTLNKTSTNPMAFRHFSKNDEKTGQWP